MRPTERQRARTFGAGAGVGALARDARRGGRGAKAGAATGEAFLADAFLADAFLADLNALLGGVLALAGVCRGVS